MKLSTAIKQAFSYTVGLNTVSKGRIIAALRKYLPNDDAAYWLTALANVD